MARVWALLLFGASNAAAAVDVVDVRTGIHPDKTRVVLELTEKTAYRISYRDQPREIIVDLKETPAGEAVAALVSRARTIGLLDQLYVADKAGDLRLHIRLRGPAVVERAFLLNPDHGRQYRFVIDLKTVSPSEWVRLVPPPVTEEQTAVVEPGPEENIEPPEKPEETVTSTEAGASPVVNLAPGPQYSEVYDDMVTDDSNLMVSGYVEAEARVFTQSGRVPGADGGTVSFALEPLFEYVPGDGSTQLIFRPFGRVDVKDSARSHFDVRELKWTATSDRWLMTVGIDTVFWGVTESNHLVDILNQDDNLEDIVQEAKLGQPMVKLAYTSDFGVFSAFVMTYFRERRYPGGSGRLKPPLPVDHDQTQYEASADKWHVDWALRWTHVIENFDIGLYHFRGTDRDPLLLPGSDGAGNAVLIPRYNLIDQTGLDVQATFTDLLLKFEAISWAGPGPNYWSMTGGFEYIFYDLFGNNADISLLGEYLYDDRGALALTPFENDVFAGLRWAANDVDNTEILVGGIFDLDSSAKFVNIEGSRRIGSHWKVTLDARFFLGFPVSDPLYALSRDDFIQIRLARYF